MQLLTYADLKQKLQNDCDITDENLVSETELLGYINEALKDAETAIHNLHHEDKYFLTSATLSWVNGTQDYDLPSDIYANKIRKIWYRNGAQNYEITRIRDLSQVNFSQSGDSYTYLIVNPGGATPGPQLRFYPTPAETSTNATVWYIREITPMTTTTTDICEVYECQNFVFAHVRNSVAIKSQNQILMPITDANLTKEYNLMLETLKEMVPDENNLMVQDLSHYWASELNWRY